MRGGPIRLLGDQTRLTHRPRKQVCVLLGIWRVETGGQNQNGLSSGIERPFMRSTVDAECSPRHDDPARGCEGAGELVSEVQRFFIGAARPDERNGACEAWEPTDHAKLDRGLG